VLRQIAKKYCGTPQKNIVDRRVSTMVIASKTMITAGQFVARLPCHHQVHHIHHLPQTQHLVLMAQQLLAVHMDYTH
jgi:hypothetical protein